MILTWLSDLNLLTNEIALNCFTFLQNHQNEDGSWKEITCSNGKPIPEWKVTDNPKSILFQTANTVFWLYQYGKNPESSRKGISFLENNYTHENADLHTKWLWAAILSKEYSWEHNKVISLLDEILNCLSDDTPPSVLTWMLWAFSVYYIPRRTVGLDDVIRLIKQNEDGGIDSDDGPSYRVHTTLERIVVFLYYG